jgi:hypothetical protein
LYYFLSKNFEILTKNLFGKKFYLIRLQFGRYFNKIERIFSQNVWLHLSFQTILTHKHKLAIVRSIVRRHANLDRVTFGKNCSNLIKIDWFWEKNCLPKYCLPFDRFIANKKMGEKQLAEIVAVKSKLIIEKIDKI